MRATLAEARRGLAARRRRVTLTALGIALAAAMLSAAIVVADGLGLGFGRAVTAADLPNVIVRFNPESTSTITKHIRALPDVGGFALRSEFTNTSIAAPGPGHSRDDAVAEVLGPAAPHYGAGYAVVAGHDLSSRGSDVLVEKGFADAWGLKPGSTLYVRGLGAEKVVGLVEAPDNVGYPLAKPRYYLSNAALTARFGPERNPTVDVAEIWAKNPKYLNELLVQARATSFGLKGLQYATRAGVQVLLSQAAGIVIDLLVALSVIALATAGAMLAASARAEVQRRLGEIGTTRAVGASGAHVTRVHATEAALVAGPAAAVGVLVGWLAISGPADNLLTLLNEPGPGTGLILPLLAGWALATGLAVAGAAWPAWRAAARPIVALLRGGDVTRRARRIAPARLGRLPRPSGLVALGARLVAARRARLATTVVTLGLSTAFVLLMLALAAELSSLQTDPTALGKRYQLTANLPADRTAAVQRIPGVQAAAPRYEVTGVDSFSLGETIDVIAYPHDHTEFEAPPLESGHRLRGEHEAEIGQGLAQALGLSPGQTLGVQLPNGAELRLTVSGVVSSLDREGRVAYVPAGALLKLDPGVSPTLAVRLRPGASQTAVSQALVRLGASPQAASTATARGKPIVTILGAIVRSVAIVDGLVCLYALVQACALTMQERRRTIAVLRACGAGPGAIRRLLFGAALTLLIPAALAGYLLERWVLGPALAHLAANYAQLTLIAGPVELAGVGGGLLVAAGLAAVWVARGAQREPVVRGLSA